RVGVAPAILAQEADRVVDADETTRLPDCSKLLVGQIARSWAQRVCIGMRRNQRCTRKFGDIPEPLLVDTRPIDQYAHLVTPPGARGAEAGQAFARTR